MSNSNKISTEENKEIKDNDRNPELETYFMRQALKIAKEALDIGEVPVGCVIVLRKDLNPEEENIISDVKVKDEKSHKNEILMKMKNVHVKQIMEKSEIDDNNFEENYVSSPQVIISHGANQVNATRDATRHAECIAIDRMLTGGLVSDQMRLPQHVFLKKFKREEKDDNGSSHTNDMNNDNYYDDWINVPSDPNHWKNSYGWGSGRLYKKEIFKYCDLYGEFVSLLISVACFLFS